MARPQQFERETVLDRAMQTFWCQGYHATSVQDLVDAMGINRGSLYHAFGDKHGLFMAVLDHYGGAVRDRWLAELDRPGSARGAISRFFARLGDFAAADRRRRGCLMCNSAVELAPHDPEVAAKLTAGFAAIEAGFLRALMRARRQGEIGEGRDLRALARFLTASLQGLLVIAKAVPDRALLEDMVDQILSVLE